MVEKDPDSVNVGFDYWSILPTSDNLPDITEPVNIDATTQPGYANRPVIEVDSSQASIVTYPSRGFDFNSTRNTLKGLAVHSFEDYRTHSVINPLLIV